MRYNFKPAQNFWPVNPIDSKRERKRDTVSREKMRNKNKIFDFLHEKKGRHVKNGLHLSFALGLDLTELSPLHYKLHNFLIAAN